jgi:HrpA-like RNA helicase
MFSRADGSVLVFMPGVPEINRLIQLLETAWRGVSSGTASGKLNVPDGQGLPRLKIMPL